MTESKVETSIITETGLTKKPPVRVLHVDDDAAFLKAAKQILEMQDNFRVETASSAEEAMKKMKKNEFDAVICDYQMPEKNGLEFLRELRQIGNTIPFIMFTGKGTEEVAIKALNLGANQYLNKNGDPETVYLELSHGIRKAAERRRVANEVWEQRLSAIWASFPDSITVSDLQGNIVDCNEAAWKLMGFSSKEELLGKSSFEFFAEKDRKILEDIVKAFEKGTVRNIECTFLKKDGEEFEGNVSAIVLKDSSGNPIGFVGMTRDITERKKMERELRAREEQLSAINRDLTLANEKLHVAGSLTRHDVRNKLSTVTGNAYLLRRKLADDPKALGQLADLETAIRQVERIFEFARTYEKLGVEQLTYLDAEKVLDEAVSLFSDLKGVKIANECRGLTVLADSLLRQLFYNLVDNSLKYGEEIQQIKAYYKKSDTDQLELVYEDDGVGIPDDVRSNLFKEGAGKGTGYGLFMIKRICEVYGWTIHEEVGTQDRGARFIITIPKKNQQRKLLYKLSDA